jgi:hypothetical protein
MRVLLSEILPKEKRLLNWRPEWLRGCELDVFYPRLKLAFEFNGIQHRVFTPHFHKSAAVFSAQVGRDLFKAGRCEGEGIALIIVEGEHLESVETLRERIKRHYAAQVPAPPAEESKPKRGQVVISRLHRSPPRDPFSLKSLW